MTLIRRFSCDRDGTWPRRTAVALALAIALLVPLTGVAASAAGAAAPTTSHYEQDASAATLSQQGASAGLAGSQGIVILDFGRPASNGTSDGMMSFAGSFQSFADITSAVQSYVISYYNYAPADTTLDVAVGTNDSCGLYQPCGAVVCGCPYEPSNYITWGQELAATVEQLGAWSAAFASVNGFTDTVRVVAADDAEPAFDPGYNNTYYVMQGYAQTVGGSYPPMVDYGSADPGFWTQDQLLQVANGFPPNVAMPEIYNPVQVGEWANLVAYAQARGVDLNVFGVLTTPAGSVATEDAVVQTLSAVGAITGQGVIQWASDITY